MILLGVAVFGFMVLKAEGSSFTHDESFSYTRYIDKPFLDILSFKHWYTNNHILNTLGMKYSEKVWGSSELALRLPNLLLMVAYMVYGYLLFRRHDRLVAFGAFALMCTNYVLLDYFGLARGYGLSFGFMLMSLYHYIQYFESRRLLHLLLFHLGGLLSILSNFPLVNVYVALLVLFPVLDALRARVILGERYRPWPSLRVHILPFAFNVIVLYEPFRHLLRYSSLDFGGKKGFLEDTVAQVVRNTLQEFVAERFVRLWAILFAAVVLLTTLYLLWRVVRRDSSFLARHHSLLVVNASLVLFSVASILQHYLFQADYPKARFSLFLVPLILIHLSLLFAHLAERWKWAVRSVMLGFALLTCTRFVSKAELRACGEWHLDMETKAVVEQLQESYAIHGLPGSKVKLGIDWFFEPTINFYRQTWQLDWLKPVDRLGLKPEDNYQYGVCDNPSVADTVRYEVLARYPRINTCLVRRK